MAVLITGGGLIGSQVARILVEQGERPTILDLAPQPRALADIVDLERVTVVRGDLLNPLELVRVIREASITRIAHTAAYPNLGAGAQQNPYAAVQVNILGLANVLEAARLHGVERVVLTSTAAAAMSLAGGEDGGDRYKEEAFPRPNTFYGLTKQVGENLGINYATAFGLDFVAVRFPNVAGPWRAGGGGRPSTMFRNLVEASVTGKEFAIPPGNMEWLYSKDAARGVVLALNAKGLKSRVFNLGIGRAYANHELVQVFKQVVPNARLRVSEEAPSETAGRPLRALDLTRSKGELGFEASYDLPRAVADYVEWYRNLKP